MNFNPEEYKYSSKRNVVYGHKGMVATSQPLAAQAGLEILKLGGKIYGLAQCRPCISGGTYTSNSRKASVCTKGSS